ncbi:MAG: hypothetical protein PWP23_815 [Candidatus Sumerlaeota bacterium]|nr:hypothetical protein [Candidatus Sumerlaeota bacterium]
MYAVRPSADGSASRQAGTDALILLGDGIMPRIHALRTFAFGLLVSGLAAGAQADWLGAHRDGTNNAAVAVNAQLTDLATAVPSWSTGTGNLNAGAQPLVFDGVVYAVEFDTAVRIQGFNKADGSSAWTSADLPAGNSISYGSVAAPVIDPAGRALYYGCGTQVAKFDLDETVPANTAVWSTPLTATNTDANGEYDIINSSASLGAGNVFIKTYKGFGSTRDSQIVALDQATGSVEWFAAPGGPGQMSPLFADLGATQLVITDAQDGSGNGGLVAYDAATGVEVWNHATVASPWNTGGRQFYGDLVLDGGTVYAFSYDFSATGDLVVVDAATGAASLYPAIGTDSPPLLAGGTLYGIGGSYGDADLRGYNPATGAQTFSADLFGGGQYIFRNYVVAVNDALYCATDNGFGSAANTFLLRLDPVNGAVASSSAAAENYTGTVSIDDDGSVFTFRAGGNLTALAVPASAGVADWLVLE